MFCGQCVEQPGLEWIIGLGLNQSFIEITRCAVEYASFEIDSGLVRQRQAPDDICAHERVTIAYLPPAPATVGMLKIVESLQSFRSHVIHFLQILFPARMSFVCGLFFNPAKDTV